MINFNLEQTNFNKLHNLPNILFPHNKLFFILLQLKYPIALLPHGIKPLDRVTQNLHTRHKGQLMKLPYFPLVLSIRFDIRTYQSVKQEETIVETEVISLGNSFG